MNTVPEQMYNVISYVEKRGLKHDQRFPGNFTTLGDMKRARVNALEGLSDFGKQSDQLKDMITTLADAEVATATRLLRVAKGD